MSTRDYSFQSQLAMSQGSLGDDALETILLANIPGAVSVEKAHEGEDRQGTDYWIYRQDAKPLSIDVKVRAVDPIESFGEDDLALELWSVKDYRVGWTLDEAKQSDYILWLFQPTKRWALIPFPLLCAVFQEHKDTWAKQYKHGVQSTNAGSWHSECVFVPRRVVWAALYRRYGGASQQGTLETVRT